MTASRGRASPADGRRPGRRAAGHAAWRYLPPPVVLAGVLVVWELATAGTGRRVIPPPSAILAALGTATDLLLASALATIYEALGGLAIGTVRRHGRGLRDRALGDRTRRSCCRWPSAPAPFR